MSMLFFDTEQIAALSRTTLSHQQQWDAIWERVRSRLAAIAATALSAEPGGSLDHRTAEYQRRAAAYNDQLRAQAAALARVGATAETYNQQMARVVAGS